MMRNFNLLEDMDHTIIIDITGGQEDISDRRPANPFHLHFDEGMPGIIWFNREYDRVFEVVGYEWSGPQYRDYVYERTETSGDDGFFANRKGRVAGALIGTAIAPGIGTIIGAAVGTGKKKDRETYSESRVESREIRTNAFLRLRDITNDNIIRISFLCDSDIDARIRNNVSVNLESVEEMPENIPEETKPAQKEPDTDMISRIRELKELLDSGAIDEEEYALLKKKLIGG